MQRVLSFEQAPPISIPLRFFLTAPLFAAAAGLLLLWSGPQALMSRWSPITLTLTHLLTLGFLAMTMAGALLQMLPVVAGASVPAIRTTAGVAHLFLAMGTIALCTGFALTKSQLFQWAIVLLLIAFAWLLVAFLSAAFTTKGDNVTLISIRFALIGLVATVGLGATLASVFAWALDVPFSLLVKLHAAWGLVGWVGMLVIGVAFQVVPMFQVTPVYPNAVSKWLAWIMFALLAAWSAASVFAPEPASAFQLFFSVCIAIGLAAFGVITLYLLWKRKRPVPDPATLFWRIGLACLLLCAAIWIAAIAMPRFGAQPVYPLMLGVVFIAGFACSIVNGMLYKIVPFLVWYHLQSSMERGQGKAPHVKNIVTDRAARRQAMAHCVALVCLVAAVFWPQWFARVAGVAFAASSIWLWVNLLQAALIYRRIVLQMHGKLNKSIYAS